VKAKYDVSSVIFMVHGRPCPPEVKFAMIEWFGPVLSEYYAGSEGGAGFMIDSHEWLRNPVRSASGRNWGPRSRRTGQ
jgi:long-chain acyl-CoA synthetase